MSMRDDDRPDDPIHHPAHKRLSAEEMRNRHSQAERIRRERTPAHGHPPRGGPSHGGSR